MNRKDETKLTEVVRRSLTANFKEVFAWKFHASEYDPPGIPDIIGVVAGSFLGLECKLATGRFTEQQKSTLLQMDKAGGLVGAILWDVKIDVYYYLSAHDVANFSLRKRNEWIVLPIEVIWTQSGPIPVLNLKYLKCLKEQS